MARVPGTDLPGLDLAQIARGFGCPAERVARAADLADLDRLLAHDGPLLLDIQVAAGDGSLY